MPLLTKSDLKKLKKKRHKYNVSAKEDRTVDGWTFDSKKEMERYKELKLLRDNGYLLPPYFLRQVPFHLPGHTTFRVDFQVFWSAHDDTLPQVTFEDVKGMRTQTYRLKKRQVEELYGIQITEI